MKAFPFILIISIYTRATSTIRNLNGVFSANSLTPCTTISSRCLSAPRRIAPTASERDCERSPPKHREGDRRTRSNSLLALYGVVSLRSRTWLLLAQRRAVRQSRRLLYRKRCPRCFRPAAGSPVRGDVAVARIAKKNCGERTRSRSRPLRAGRPGLVRKEVPRLFPRDALPPRRRLARLASAHRGYPESSPGIWESYTGIENSISRRTTDRKSNHAEHGP